MDVLGREPLQGGDRAAIGVQLAGIGLHAGQGAQPVPIGLSRLLDPFQDRLARPGHLVGGRRRGRKVCGDALDIPGHGFDLVGRDFDDSGNVAISGQEPALGGVRAGRVGGALLFPQFVREPEVQDLGQEPVGPGALRIGKEIRRRPGGVEHRLVGASLVSPHDRGSAPLREIDLDLLCRRRRRGRAGGEGAEGPVHRIDGLVHRDVADDHHLDRP